MGNLLRKQFRTGHLKRVQSGLKFKQIQLFTEIHVFGFIGKIQETL
jgi:hypothetical protein